MGPRTVLDYSVDFLHSAGVIMLSGVEGEVRFRHFVVC